MTTPLRLAVRVVAAWAALSQSGCLVVLDRARREQGADAGRDPVDAAPRADAASPLDAAVDAGDGPACRAARDCGAPGWARCSASVDGRCVACAPTYSPAVVVPPGGTSWLPRTLRVAAEVSATERTVHVLAMRGAPGTAEPYVIRFDAATPSAETPARLSERWARPLGDAAFALDTRLAPGEPSVPVVGAIDASTRVGLVEGTLASGPSGEHGAPAEHRGDLAGLVGEASLPLPVWFAVRFTTSLDLVAFGPEDGFHRVGPAVDDGARLLGAVPYDAVLYESAGAVRAWSWLVDLDYALPLPERVTGSAWTVVAPHQRVAVAYPGADATLRLAEVENTVDGVRVVEPGGATIHPSLEGVGPIALAASANGWSLAFTDGTRIMLVPFDAAMRPHALHHADTDRRGDEVFVYATDGAAVVDLAAAAFTRADGAPGVAVAATRDDGSLVFRTLIGCAP